MGIFHERFTEMYEAEKDRNYKFSRIQFAEKCGVNLTVINNYLSGRGWPTFENLKNICKNLNVNAGWLIGESDIRYNYENRFAKMANELDPNQMDAVEEYVMFLKVSAKHRK